MPVAGGRQAAMQVASLEAQVCWQDIAALMHSDEQLGPTGASIGAASGGPASG
jgi:hypothetical protein